MLSQSTILTENEGYKGVRVAAPAPWDVSGRSEIEARVGVRLSKNSGVGHVPSPRLVLFVYCNDSKVRTCDRFFAEEARSEQIAEGVKSNATRKTPLIHSELARNPLRRVNQHRRARYRTVAANASSPLSLMCSLQQDSRPTRRASHQGR